MNKTLKLTKQKIIIFVIIIVGSINYWHHFECINMYVEPNLFYNPSSCGFQLPEFLILFSLAILISFIIDFILQKGFKK